MPETRVATAAGPTAAAAAVPPTDPMPTTQTAGAAPVPDEIPDGPMPPATAARLEADAKLPFTPFIGEEPVLRVEGDMGPAMRLSVAFLLMLAVLGGLILFVTHRLAGIE